MHEIYQNYKKEYGYIPSLAEIMAMYTSGELLLTDEQEDILSALL